MGTRVQCEEKVGLSKSTAYPGRDALYVSNSKKTFAKDELLPSLPVPSLSYTLERYLDSVKAFVTEEEFEKTKRIVTEFETGLGAQLNKKLLKKAADESNWLEKWWENMAYLSQRSPLLPLCSMSGFTNMHDLWPPAIGTQIERTALYMHFQVTFWKLLREERLRPHNSHDVDWTMHQFRRYFNTVRVPGEIMDKLECYFQTESEESVTPSHVVVLHKGHIFSMEGVDEFGEVLTPLDFQLQLKRIQDWCEANGKGPSVGAMTLVDRTTWAKNREWLLQIHPDNEFHMETIDTALSVLILDDAEPSDITGITRETLAGDVTNRWADKSVANVSFKSGMFGLIADHTPFDGIVSVVAGHFVYSSLAECKGQWSQQNSPKCLKSPKHLDFHLDDHIKGAIDDAKKVYKIMVDDCDIFAGVYTDYGKSFLKPHNFHPETYAQFALQLAYYSMHGKPAATYVTATTRQYYHGRTETMRSCFPEVMDWVFAMKEDEKLPSEKLHLMQVASDKFKKLMKDATENNGCDRHLLGLYMVSVEEEIPLPDIFSDPSWVKSGGSGNFVLSTSCVGYTPLGGCVMPMREDGYGTFYNIENNRFTFTVSAFHRCPETNAQQFFHHIERALESMQHMLLSARL